MRTFHVEVARAEVVLDKILAVGDPSGLGKLKGIPTVDPTYGMPGLWIDSLQIPQAEQQGCLVFNTVSVIATLLMEKTRAHAPELLQLTELRRLLGQQNEALVREVIPGRASVSQLREVLRGLLAERVSIRELGSILECLAKVEPGSSTQSMVESVRVSLSPQIYREHLTSDGSLNVIALDSALEHALQKAFWPLDSDETSFVNEELGREIVESLLPLIEATLEKNLQPIILTTPPLRLLLRKLALRSFPNIVILSWDEIPTGVNPKCVGTARLGEPNV